MIGTPKVYCIVVTYRPRETMLRATLDSIRKQAAQIIVVDNSEELDPGIEFGPARHLRMERNRGIAAAQNAGIEVALAEGAEYVWLSDQDTVYPSDFLARLLEVAADCRNRGVRFAALAPAFFDTVTGQPRAFIRHEPFVRGFRPAPGPNAMADAIASGTLIPADVFRVVGMMREDLFIDWVDLEWCWRARRCGMSIIGVGDVVIQHEVGDHVVAWRGRQVTMRSPLRHYYMIRNAIYLSLHSSVPSPAIRLEIGARAVAWAFLYPALAREGKIEHLHACIRALLDGMRARLGPRRP